MSGSPLLFQLPLLLAGIPTPVEEILRLAGVPVARFDRQAADATAAGKNAARFVLFDSRLTISRSDAQVARQRGQTIIDLAELVEDRDDASSGHGDLTSANRPVTESTLLTRLKQELEKTGGLWLRVADYPFPYQSVFCNGGVSPSGELARIARRWAGMSPAATHQSASGEGGPSSATDGREQDLSGRGSNHTLSRLRWRYASGLPLLLPYADDVSQDILRVGGIGIDDREFPLLWQTTSEEFDLWMQARANIAVSVQAKDGDIRIGCQGQWSGFRPAVELWRGDHVASLPLSAGVTDIQADGLAFLHECHKHPAGFVAKWLDCLDWETRSERRSA